ncbi:hypothetical protein GCM10010435_83430 [Winogradskya consettensis]|uniref:Secreted protein n=1 Tax=Winogradskya consettensis TaxID=113560 RepID=A0A919SZJ3_9ACTN|nr:hypothetical protein [Actinoplanes consettensis]GIM82256.1 hypothetical protein Aco04nite_80670 [Actinoplanes consettensis]
MRIQRLFAAALAGALVFGGGTQAVAAPEPGPPVAQAVLPGGWSIEQGQLVWRAGRQVPAGDSAVEFFSGERRLGVPRFTPDHTTFRLGLSQVPSLTDLSVRAAGRRLDQTEPVPQAKAKQAVSPPPVLPASNVDPGVKGRYKTVEGEYQLPAITLADYAEPVEMQAVVVAPENAPGKRPLALFLHGRHATCYSGDDWFMEWPCPGGTQPIPSDRGYLQAQRLLASQGWITVSISANGINGQDDLLDDGGAQGRSLLVRQHLARWADWAGAGRATAPAIVRSAPRADLSNVFLMGHSRGGEGVSRAAMDSLSPPAGDPVTTRWTIRGMLLIGPTIFGQNPVPDVPSVTILPGCDGDVTNLQGQMFIDETRGVSAGTALHSSLYVVGANHNFFNTEWTPGQAAAFSFDDWEFTDPNDAVCGTAAPTRLTAEQQQDVGATYIAAAARLFTGDDRMLPLLDGSGVRAPSADPAHVLSHALGGARKAALLPDPTIRTGGGARICEQITYEPADYCVKSMAGRNWAVHFTTFRQVIPEPGRYAAEMHWSAAGTPLTLTPAQPVALAGYQDLALRLIVPPNSTGTRFGVSVVNRSGKRTSIGEVRVDGLPGTGQTVGLWAQEVRVPLRGLHGELASLELTPRTANGQAWLLDAWGYRPGTPDPRTSSLPRIDLGDISVTEGDSGSRAYELPVRVTGNGGGRVQLTLLDTSTLESTSWTETVAPGQRLIEVPVEVTGDTLYGEGEEIRLLAKAERGLVVGDYQGTVEVRNDDPAPQISLTPVADTVAEGGTLSWRATLSTEAETAILVIGTVEAPAEGTELSTLDVDPDWLLENSAERPEPERPLSQTGAVAYTYVYGGELSADIDIPTVTDTVVEGPEVVSLQFSSEVGGAVGTVTDTPDQ